LKKNVAGAQSERLAGPARENAGDHRAVGTILHADPEPDLGLRRPGRRLRLLCLSKGGDGKPERGGAGKCSETCFSNTAHRARLPCRCADAATVQAALQ
jgi:hypothetical protein